MIHYHGTPASGSRQEVARFLAGRHALVPYPRQDDMPVVGDVCQSFILDNGAFSAWTRGTPMDVQGYIAWCLKMKNHPAYDWALIPDVIDGTEEENDRMLALWPADVPGVPVWHLNESIERLQRLGSSYGRVALGSSGEWRKPGTEKWWDRMNYVMEMICDSNGTPFFKLHGLRMLSPKIFTRLPLASADSTNAGQNGGSVKRFGMYAPPRAGTRAAIIAERIEAYQSPAAWTKDPQGDLFSAMDTLAFGDDNGNPGLAGLDQEGDGRS